MTAKILLFDIETAPALSYTWGRWKVNIGGNQVAREGYMLCWAAKWLGSNETFYDSLPNHKVQYKQNPTNDIEIVKSLSEMLNEADIVVAHNGDGFDMKWVRKQLAKHDLPDIKPQKYVDTYKVAKRHFNFPSNRLDEVAKYLGLNMEKLPTDFDLWRGCMDGDKESWEYMVDYNIQDLVPLEGVYLRLRRFMNNHPNVSVYSDLDEAACNHCGSTNLRRDGYAYTNLGKFQRFECKDCGSRKPRGRTNLLTKEQRKVLKAGTV